MLSWISLEIHQPNTAVQFHALCVQRVQCVWTSTTIPDVVALTAPVHCSHLGTLHKLRAHTDGTLVDPGIAGGSLASGGASDVSGCTARADVNRG